MRLLFCLLISLTTLFTACNGSSSEQGPTTTPPPPPPKTVSKNHQPVLKPTPKERPAENPDITVEISGLTAGKVNLVGMFQGQQYLADTGEAAATGKIRLKKEEPYKQGLYFLVFENNQNLQMILSEDQTFKMKTTINDVNGSMKVTGSLDNQLLYESMAFEQGMRPKFAALSKK